MNWTLLAIGGYLAAQLAIGAWLAPRIRTEEDYLVGGRQLGYPLTIFSIFATWFGAESCIAAAGRAHREGFALSNAEPFAYGLTLIAMGLVFAVPLWNRQLTTLADLYRQRYGVRVEKLAAIALIPSGLLWAAAQLRGFGQVLATVTTLDIELTMIVAATFCVAYTMLGGLMADAITDLLQGAVLVVGLVILAVAVMLRQGGAAEAFHAIDPSRIMLVDPAAGRSALALVEEWAVPIAGSVVAVELVSRVLAARSPVVARRGALTAGGIYIAIGMLPVFIGLAAGGLVGPVDDPERFLPTIAQAVLPPALFVILAGALISAILSTIDTILLVAAGLATHNVVAPMLGISSDRGRLRLVRGGVAMFGLLALWLASGARGVAELVEEASSFGSAGILVVTSFALFSTRGGPAAATVTLLGGLATYVAASGSDAAYPFLTSLAASVLLYLLVALAERPRVA